MIRIMIVDDDPFFHTIFKNLIEWEAYGCTLHAQVESGQQAILELAAHGADVLITDMVMPGINGVELIRYVRKEYPKIRCFALSSFDDFNYVRQSLKEGAEDYLLKHALNRSVIEELLRTINTGAARRDEVAVSLSQPEAVFSDVALSLIQREKACAPDDLRHLIDSLHIDFPAPPLMVISAEIHDVVTLLKRFEYRDRYVQFFSVVCNILQSTLERYGKTLCISDQYSRIYAVVSNAQFSSRLFSETTAHTMKKSLVSIVNRYCNITISIETCSECEAIDKVLPAFWQLEALSKRDTGFVQDALEDAPIVSVRLSTERALLESINDESFEDAHALIAAEFETALGHSPSMRTMRHIAMEFLNLLNRICYEKGIRLESLCDIKESPYETCSRISTKEELQPFICNIYRALHEQLHAVEHENILVKKAVREIQRNYSEDISLSSVSKDIHCNASYLSHLFKDATGQGFVQYLTDYRLNQACRLMESSNLPIREIARMTGFRNYNYFFKLFKQSRGITPQTYIKTHGK